MRNIVIGAVLFLAACATTQSPAQQLYNTCRVYTSGLETVVRYGEQGLISRSTLERVDDVDDVAGSICMGEYIVVDGEVSFEASLAAVEEALLVIATAKKEVE